jgi:hypothetical protein
MAKSKKMKPIIKRSLKSGLKEDFGYMKEGAKIAADVIIPRSKEDVAWLFAGGAAGRAVGGIAKKGAKFVSKAYRNMGR